MLNQDDLVSLPPVALNLDLRHVDTRVQLNNELVLEALLARVEKVLELFHKLAEYDVDQLSLHLGCQRLVQIVFLNNQVEIKVESISHSVLDASAKLGMHIVRFVRKLNAVQPELHFAHPRIEQILKVSLRGEETGHDADENGIVTEAYELKQEGEKVLLCRASRVITVTHRRHDREAPV